MQNTYEKHIYTLGESEITLHITYREGLDRDKGNLILRPYTLLNCLPPTYTKLVGTILETFDVIFHLSPMNAGKIKFFSSNREYSIFPLNIFSKESIERMLGSETSQNIINMVWSFGLWLISYLFAKEIFLISPFPHSHNTYNINLEFENSNKHEHCTCDFITTKKNSYDLAITAGFNAKLLPSATVQVKNDGSIKSTLQSRGSAFTEIRIKKDNITSTKTLLTFTRRLLAHLNNHCKPSTYTWCPLKPGDTIDLIAISSHYNPIHLKMIKTILEKYNLKVLDRFAHQKSNSLEYSNSDTYRSQQLYNALRAPDSSAIWAIKGGSGASRILENFLTYPPFPCNHIKPVIGYSDITGLHLALNTLWNWPTIHGIFPSSNRETIPYIHNWTNCEESIGSIIDILQTDKKNIVLNYKGIIPLNSAASNATSIQSTLLGGNMTLVCNLTSSPFLPLNKPHILILEDVGVSPRQAERFLDLLRYGVICQYTQAILFGQLIEIKRPTILQTINMKTILRRFATKISTPVFFWPFFGHGTVNRPLPLNTTATLSLDTIERFTLKVQTK